MAKTTVILEKFKCIGCGTCAALCPEFWELEDMKAKLKGSKLKNTSEGEIETLEKDLNKDQLKCNHDCEQNCPVACIQVK
ncbi:MAG: hypothetical protein COT15_05110 [Candidatus Diapherotrites archaeon CG08_land_8_20_14_0_20_34_12]|nr:MAG: hypothetical protein COT15_05110 [Candidatus Diapherotrites archaeon CG08_land_8_20_14_0_20_34_12]